MSDHLCDVSDLTEGVPKAVRANGRGVAVVSVGGTVYAFESVCPHWGGPLGEGTISVARHEVTCPWHRFRYSLRDGSCVASTGRPSVPVFPVTIEGGKVMADVPPPVRAKTAAAGSDR